MLEYLVHYCYKDQDFQKSKLYFDMLFKKFNLSKFPQKVLSDIELCENSEINKNASIEAFFL